MITKNDIVVVNFNNVQYTLCKRAKVIYTPAEAGDSWVFEDLDNSKIHYVSEPCTVTLLEKHSK